MSQKSKRCHALQNQIKRLNTRVEKLQTISNRFTWYRLICFFGGLGLGVATYYLIDEWLGWAAIGSILIIFNIIAWFHRKIILSVTKHQIWVQIKSTQVARMNLDWQHIPHPSVSEPNPLHPFEIDLDLTGKNSLHQLVDTAISRDGSQLLQDWLLHTLPEPLIIQNRQALIQELTPLTRFRDKLLLAYNLVSKEQFEGKKLLNWLKRQSIPKFFKWSFSVSLILAGLNIGLFTLNMLNILPAYWIVSLTIYGIIYYMNFEIGASLLNASDMLSDELQKFKVVLLYLEKYPYGTNENLTNLCRPFSNLQTRPSVKFKYLNWLRVAIGIRMNMLTGVILNAVMPWDFFCYYWISIFKTDLAVSFPTWLNVFFELEALVSMANFAYLNPDYVFPKIVVGLKNNNEMFFEAKSLGHPLIPGQQKKCNDFEFKHPGEIALITGSNMSGKSTFLKTLGMNLCLAFAGGPVNAKSLQTSLFRIYTCIQINDSVTGGFSFFYAEVQRLKNLLDELEKANDVALLFLIDEIFKGTNNRERLIGSRSYIQALVGHHGLGIISTHDLELTKLAEKIPKLTNYHFREDVKEGKMVFDYKMRSGACPTTNALKIMRMEGLPVEGA